MSSSDSRIELAGLPGIPEVLLSETLIATLPDNLADAPWTCKCSAVMWLGRGGRAAASALPPALQGRPALATVGGFVHYTETPVGPYDEVLGMVGSRDGARPWGHVALMAVDSPTSLVGGRTNWAMPKTLARFDGTPAAGHTVTATGEDGVSWSVSATTRAIGPAVPVWSKGTARQQFSDGRVGASALTFSGRARPAIVTVQVSSEGSLSDWLKPGRHLGAVIERATFTLGLPRFR
jgi:Acetoacetate decarboxylase (ADC)